MKVYMLVVNLTLIDLPGLTKVVVGLTFNKSASLPTTHLMDDDGNQTQGDSAATVTHGGMRRRGRLRSIVWEHFEKKEINGINKVVCNYCNNALVARSTDGTKALARSFKDMSSEKGNGGH
ncbi:hypothetical protein WN944_026763 [Citrus x changshan-huyou]|uniref:BED-type domain-containing protein n=1 Tax=Citrus x changshan-huyou TaxID=2935761 RepID=A0AAP0LKK4_9ROSI